MNWRLRSLLSRGYQTTLKSNAVASNKLASTKVNRQPHKSANRATSGTVMAEGSTRLFP